MSSERRGGHLVAESLRALGAEAVFGVPGVHALGAFEGVRATGLDLVGARTELAAAFMADGFARSGGAPAPLLLSTGPGVLIGLAGLMEAASSYVPVVAIASQIASDLIGRGRGALHELSDQLAAVGPIVKWAGRAESTEAIPALLAEAWRAARRPPPGPVFLEIPVDVLMDQAGSAPPTELRGDPERPQPDSAAVAEAGRWLAEASNPLIIAGGGVVRAAAGAELRRLAEALDAPVLMTYMGKGSISPDHPLAVGSACEEPAWQRAVAEADVVVCLGSELGSESSGQYRLRPPARLIQVDASPSRIGTTYPALGLIGDLPLAVRALLSELAAARDAAETRGGASRAAALRRELETALRPAGRVEPGLLDSISGALPPGSAHAWDMTMLGYWAASALPVRPTSSFLYPLGSGTLGYAYPAALGAALATQRPSLAVVGDGGIAYAGQELATAAQHGIATTLLIVDDGGYGVLREYQRASFGVEFGVDLVQPDFTALAAAHGVPARATSSGTLRDDLDWALSLGGPALLALSAALESPPSFE